MTAGRWTVVILAVVVVGGATVTALRPHGPPPLMVTTSPVKRTNVTRTVSAAGHLQARETVKISSNVSGTLLSLAVHQGDRVRAGQVIGQVDRRLYESQVAQARAAVAAQRAQVQQSAANILQLRADLVRSQQLVSQRMASDAEAQKANTALAVEEGRLAQAREGVRQSEAQLASAEFNLSLCTLIAPMDGTILELDHKVGERLRGSEFSEDVVALLGGLTDMELKAEVGEHEVVAVHEGDSALVDIDAFPDQQFHGRVAEVSKNALIKNPGTDAEVTTFYVRVALLDPPKAALPGMSSAVSISAATHENVLTVPLQAVTARAASQAPQQGPSREGVARADASVAPVPTPAGTPATALGKPKMLKVVFVVGKDGKAQMREVHTGIASRTDVEILDGLREGDSVVDGPYRVLARELSDGQAVMVPPPPKPGAAPEHG